MKQIFISLILILLLQCKPENPKPQIAIESNQVLLINEGNFQWGNAQLGLYNINSKNYIDDVFYKVNQQKLGDVLQSVSHFEHQYFMIMNNSGTIIVTDTAFHKKGIISHLNSPRYLEVINTNEAIVTHIYGDTIHLVDLKQFKIKKSFYLSGWNEKIINWNSKYLICNLDSQALYKMDLTTNQISKYAQLKGKPIDFVIDQDNSLWVLTGAFLSNSDNYLYQFLPNQNSYNQKIDIKNSLGTAVNALEYNSKTNHLYLANENSIYQCQSQTAQQISKLLDINKQSLYGFNFNSLKQEFWISDAKDYIQKSQITVYSLQDLNNIKYQFLGGIGCNGFLFKNK